MSEIIVQFLIEKFRNDLQEAEREFSQKLPHQYREIKSILEGNTIIIPSRLKEAKRQLYTLNDTLAECVVTFDEQRKAQKTKPLSRADKTFLRKIQRLLDQIKAELPDIITSNNDNANAAAEDASFQRQLQPSSLSLSATDDSLERLIYGSYEIHGFDQQLKNIEKLLFERRRIGIVGIGGSGKTALTQMLLKKLLLEKQFQFAFWVCLSDRTTPSDERVLLKYVKDSEGYLWVDRQVLWMDEMWKMISSTAGECLLVLDDAKCVSYWHGKVSGGSAVIVTSRDLEVAEEMVGEGSLYNMQLVMEAESCWSIFEDAVEEYGLIDKAHHTLLRMKDEIVERCYGLPLAAKTLAEIISKRIYEADE